MTELEMAWLDYSWSVITDRRHILECERSGGRGIEDPSLRWPGYLGERYEPNGLLLVANIHRDFASGGAGEELADQMVKCTREWRDKGRSERSDRNYLSRNRSCYVRGLNSWRVGYWFRRFLHEANLQFEDVAYLNAARCQNSEDTCHALQRLCLRRFPLSDLETTLRPRLVLTSSIMVRDDAGIRTQIRCFNQRNGCAGNNRCFEEWKGEALECLSRGR